MTRARALAGSAVFLALAPGIVAGVVPWWMSRWRVEPPFLGMPVTRLAGVVLVALGAIGLVDSFARFALQGIGTPAPIAPTRHLVITGLYRYVRNPMYVAVVSVIIGQGLLFANAALLEYGGIVWLVFHLFVLLYEEPKLRASFGAEYLRYLRAVPRWIPRWRPWREARVEQSGV